MAEGWVKARLGTIASVDRGVSWTKAQESRTVEAGARPVVRIGNVQPTGIDMSDRLWVRGLKDRDIERKSVRSTTILMVGSNGNPERIGNVHLAGEELDRHLVASFLMAIDPVGEVLPSYLLYYLQSDAVQHRITEATAGSTGLKNISLGWLRDMSILVPPLVEQRRIVDLIAAADAVLAAARGLLSTLSTLVAAIRHEVFNDEAGVVVPLGDLCDPGGIQIGPFGSQLHAHDYVDDGIPTVMPKNIRAGRIVEDGISRVGEDDWQRLSKHHLRAGDIVLPRRGDLAKRALVTSAQAGWLCGTGSVRVRLSPSVDPLLVFEALSTAATDRWLAENAVGATMPNLNTEIVGRIPVTIPNGDLAPITQVLRDGVAYSERAMVLAARVSEARSALLASLFSGEHQIPDSYDALLEPS